VDGDHPVLFLGKNSCRESERTNQDDDELDTGFDHIVEHIDVDVLIYCLMMFQATHS
jgi:hypothetical protein